MTPKEIFQKVKALFDAPITTPVAAGTATTFKLKDGSEVSIAIEDPAVSMLPDVGDIVSIAGNPAPAGDYELEDGTTFTVDATGAITVIVTPEPQLTAEQIAAKAAADAAAEAAKNQPQQLSMEDIRNLMKSFATGTPEERVANLEIMVKALMECNFGYRIREGQEDAAIQVYKDSLTPIQSGLAKQEQELQAATQKIEKQTELIKGLFELVEKLVEEPTTNPVTLTGVQKERFEKREKREDRYTAMAEAMKKNKGKVLS